MQLFFTNMSTLPATKKGSTVMRKNIPILTLAQKTTAAKSWLLNSAVRFYVQKHKLIIALLRTIPRI